LIRLSQERAVFSEHLESMGIDGIGVGQPRDIQRGDGDQGGQQQDDGAETAIQAGGDAKIGDTHDIPPGMNTPAPR